MAGRCLLDTDELRGAGFEAAYALTDLEPDERRSMASAGPLLRRLAARVAQDWLDAGGASADEAGVPAPATPATAEPAFPADSPPPEEGARKGVV